MRVPAQTWAALSPAEPASTRRSSPRPVAAWLAIRASWPAPTMPTTGAFHPSCSATAVSLRGGRSGWTADHRAPVGLIGRGQREEDGEHGWARPDQHDPATFRGRHRAGQREAEAGAVRAAAHVPLEDARDQGLGHAAAFVADLDHD